METAILIGIGILTVAIIVRQFMANAKGKGCASCGEACGRNCHDPGEKQRFSPPG